MDPCLITEYVGLFVLKFIAQKASTACARASYAVVPLTSLNKYLHNDTSETELCVTISVNLAVKIPKINTATTLRRTRALTS